MAINWGQTAFGVAPQGPDIRYDENGLPIRNIGGVEAGMAMRWDPALGRQNTPVGIGSGRPGGGLPPVWEGQENDRPTYDRIVDTSWDFDPFVPSSPQGGNGSGSGGMSPQPRNDPFAAPLELGRDSPWGDPNIAGNNQDFYRQQLERLNFQQDTHQNEAIANAVRREAAQNVPRETQAIDWSWTELPEVKVAGAPNWQLAQGINQGATNQQVYDQLGGRLSNEAQDYFADMFLANPSVGEGTGWAQRGSPDAFLRGDTTTDPSNMPYVAELANALYRNVGSNNQTGVPAGYALPRG